MSSELAIQQLAQQIALLSGVDAALALAALHAVTAVGALCGALWGSAVGLKFSWRTLAWCGALVAVGWKAYRHRRLVAKYVRHITRKILAGDEDASAWAALGGLNLTPGVEMQRHVASVDAAARTPAKSPCCNGCAYPCNCAQPKSTADAAGGPIADPVGGRTWQIAHGGPMPSASAVCN